MNEIQTIEREKNELLAHQAINAVTLFTPDKMDELLSELNEKIDEFQPDISTEIGRKAIKSMGHKVARSKTALDNLGKELVSEWTEKTAAVNAERKKMRDHLDDKKRQVLKPLTDYEEKEEKRVADIRNRLAEIFSTGDCIFNNWQSTSMIVMVENLKKLDAIEITSVVWQEFELKARQVKEIAVQKIKDAITRREEYDRDQAELEQLREDKRLSMKRENDDRIKQEAAEKVQADKDSAEHDRIAKEEAKRKAAILAKKQADAAAKKAVQQERDRKEQEENARLADIKRREADKKWRGKINNETVTALATLDLSQDTCEDIVRAVARGLIPNMTMNY